jgi:hypothetical protein
MGSFEQFKAGRLNSPYAPRTSSCAGGIAWFVVVAARGKIRLLSGAIGPVDLAGLARFARNCRYSYHSVFSVGGGRGAGGEWKR